ncbi:uncharacterized protein LOC125254461 isoform X2 [Megalobrama amblycephala]|nr:uncharacterized protein LOC125254461 isoform X2 [Megalobrama amblycephala]
MEGPSVTLHADGQYKQITWMFRHEKWIIASCNIRDTPLCEITLGTDELINNSFRDRLQTDDHDGSLTIKNISDEHAGLYTLQIFNKSNKKDEKKFNVSISPPKTVNDSKCSECVRQCSVENATRVTLSWNISSTAPFLEVEYQDTNGNSCEVNSSVTDLTKQDCQCMSPRSDSESGLSPWLIGVLVLLGVAVVAAAAVIFYKNFYKKCKAEQNGKYYLQSTQIV